MFATESIFFGMYESVNSTSYTDYSNLFLANTVIDPQTEAGYGSIILKSITSSNLEIYQSTFCTIDVISSIAIPTGSWIYITFPKEFNNFNNIPVVVQTQYGIGNYEVSTSSEVINTRIGYQLNTLSLPANTVFQVMITSLLTPIVAATISMNSMKIMVAASDKLSTIATTI